jgi:hypothetical protein
MTRTSPLSLARVVVIGVAVSFIGCGDGDKRPEDTAGSSRVASDSGAASVTAPPPDYAEIARSGRTQYRYGGAQDPIDATRPDELVNPEDPGVEPTMTFARATLNAGESAYGKVIGRIVSNIDVPRLGIRSGVNYVWQKRIGTDTSTWDFYTVPDADPSRGRPLRRGSQFTDAGHPGTHLVRARKQTVGPPLAVSFAFGVCTDDCPSGHCGLQ